MILGCLLTPRVPVGLLLVPALTRALLPPRDATPPPRLLVPPRPPRDHVTTGLRTGSGGLGLGLARAAFFSSSAFLRSASHFFLISSSFCFRAASFLCFSCSAA